MPTTTPVIKANVVLCEVQKLGELLFQSVAAHRYDTAQECSSRLLALHSFETHAPILSVLERARRAALVQRSAASSRLADLERAAQYALSAENGSRYAGRG